MINVLVTGANGQLGKTINSLKSNMPSANFTFKSSQDLDITNEPEVIGLLSSSRFNYCINCAAYTNVDNAEKEKQKAYDINAKGVKNLAVGCKDHETVLIHISTDFVFDGSKNEPYSESDITNPISVYGLSKLKGEKEILRNDLEKHFIIRTSWLYSKYGKNFVKTMLRLSKSNEKINVVSDQIGSPTYTGDLVVFIFEIIKSRSKKYGTYHYSNLGKATWFDFASEIFNYSGNRVEVLPIKTEDYKTLAKRPVYSVLSKKKIKNNFNITPPFWKDSLKEVVHALVRS